MNRQAHRLVLNKSRGCLKAVAETASSDGQGKQRGGDAGIESKITASVRSVSVFSKSGLILNSGFGSWVQARSIG